MTWEWSHAPEAYAAAEENLGLLSRKRLLEIAAEWRANVNTEEEKGFDEVLYRKALKDLAEKTNEALIADIWRRAEEQRNCTNGGWKAHMCPFGCDPHMVSFSYQDEEALNA